MGEGAILPVSSFGPGAGEAEAGGTLDEPVLVTLRRDLGQIGKNLRLVVFPFWTSRDNSSKALRNWDLWGPLFFTLMLALVLSSGAAKEKASATFSIVFAVLSLGALVLTVNVILLGGQIKLFQALCLMGYCLAPLDLSALVCLAVKHVLVRLLVTLAGVGWAAWASVPFITATVSQERRVLVRRRRTAAGEGEGRGRLTRRRAQAAYPVVLLYTFLAWLSCESRERRRRLERKLQATDTRALAPPRAVVGA